MQSVSGSFTSALQGEPGQGSLIPKFEVKWDGASWTDETDRLLAHSGNLKFSLPGDSVGAKGAINTAQVVLYNDDWRYSAYHVLDGDSTIKSYINGDAGMFGIEVRLYEGLVISGTPEYVRIFTGIIYDWQEDSNLKQIRLMLKDIGFKHLQYRSSSALYTNIQADEYLEALAVDLLGFTRDSDAFLDASHVILPYAWLDDDSILEEMWEVAAAEGGRLYFDQLGNLRFETMNHWLLSPHQSSQWTFTNYLYNLQPQTDVDDLATKIVVEWQPRLPEPSTIVYELETPHTIQPGGSVTFEARLSKPCSAIYEPIAEQDYWMQSPGGANMMADCTVTLTTYAQRASIQIDNANTIMPGIVSFLRLRGSPIGGGPSQQVEVEQGSPPIDFDRIRSLRGNLYAQSKAQADMLANYLADKHKQLVPVWTIDVDGIPQIELGDLVTLRDDRVVDITRYGYVIGIRWRTGTKGLRQTLDIIDSANLYPYGSYYYIGTTALGSGVAWY